MKVLVTGATGFVGQAIVRALRRREHAVVGLVRDAHKGQALEQLGAMLVVGDMLEPASYDGVVPAVDAVIQAAQYGIQGRLTRKKFAQIEQADVFMTRTLARACLAHDKTLLYTSGVFNYGDHGDEWITEQTPLYPSPLGEAHTKMVEELLPLARDQHLRVIILSPGFVYGPGGLFKQSFYDTLQKGQLRIFGKGQNYWSVIHVDDLAAAYALAVESEAYGETYNIVDDQPLRLYDLVNTFTDAMGKKRVGSMAPWLLKLIIGGPLVESLVTSFRISNAKAKRELGWQPRYSTFKEGLPGVLTALEAEHEARFGER
ncbi:MAG TPA: NAD-dependent epimerase/dehydratase family protein [Ktedonobacteraceae bacterium]|nr:NAD-dependent epimerase/dehydratase family protein [Ktedonobacteraceae bacterium]